MTSKLITVLSDKHQREYAELERITYYADWAETRMLVPALVSRMAWLEYQAKLKIESILEFCRTGK